MQKNIFNCKCEVCGKEFHRSKSGIRKHVYCSKDCEYKGKKLIPIHKLELKHNINNLGDWLKEQYIDKKRSTTSIREELGIGTHQILRYLKMFNIKIRSKSDSVKISWKNSDESRHKIASENAIKNLKDRTKLKQIMQTEEYKEKQRISKTGSKNGMYGVRGKDNPLYNESIPIEERINRRILPEYRIWRESVYNRDKYICQCCGYNKGKILVAHHLNSYMKYKEDRFDVNNGITLCEECHKKFHSMYGYGNNTREQFNDFINKKVV